jgi:hypothetical protein
LPWRCAVFANLDRHSSIGGVIIHCYWSPFPLYLKIALNRWIYFGSNERSTVGFVRLIHVSLAFSRFKEREKREPLLLAPAASRYRKKRDGSKSGATRRRGERGETTRTPLPTHPRRSTPLSFSLPLALHKNNQRKRDALSPTSLLHKTTRIPIRVLLVVDVGDDATVPRGEPAPQPPSARGLGREPGGMDPEKRGYELRILSLRLRVAGVFLDSIWLAGGRSSRPVKQPWRALLQQ